MRLAPCALFVLVSVSTASAQTPSRAQLVLTILGGAVTGHSLWDVPVQAVSVLDSSLTPTGVNDTVHLGRDVTSSIIVGAAGTYFLSPHFGLHAEISYLGLPFDDSCAGTFHPDPQNKNQQVCDDIASHAGAGGSVSLFVGATLRAASTRSLSPYVRANIGIATTPHSTVAVTGNYFTQFGPEPVLFVHDPSPRSSGPLFGFAVGLTQPAGKEGSYQFRLELRDAITGLERLTGPADPATLLAPTEIKSYHHFSLVIGLDVVLEKARGRRY